MKQIATATLTAALILGVVSCKRDTPAPQAVPSAQEAAAKRRAEAPKIVATAGTVSIILPPANEGELPEGKGRLTMMAACSACHTNRYVLMQPNFPRKTWIAEVDKMKKVYGAPILDEQVEPIVNYLVSIRETGSEHRG